jgi:crotonobetainyl-CoA:carnitine CoA-transferase CaiB-like acyl-CoA transferase
MTSLLGVRVAEFTHFIAGPHCAQILADHGADVVKVEPTGGEPSRRALPRHEGASIYFAAHNRGKRSLAVDLKSEAGRGVLRRLLEWAHVVVTNYTPRAAERLGIDFAAASAVNPGIVVLQISAFGATGPGRDLAGYDGTVQGRSGIADMTGPVGGPPIVSQIQVVDHLTAVEGALGVALALRLRDATGRGQLVDVSMLDCAMSLLAHQVGDTLLLGARPRSNGSAPPYALANLYEAADGHVYLAPVTPPMWEAMCRITGHPDWCARGSPYLDLDTRIRDRTVIETAFNEWTRRHTREQVIGVLGAAGIACGPVSHVEEALDDPIARARGMVRWVESDGVAVPVPGVELKLGETAPVTPGVVPALGAHTREVLTEIGCSEAEITQLV